MATTTNYGWETPDDTDLVKDGALAQRTTASAIDSSLYTINGGSAKVAGHLLSTTSLSGSSVTFTNAFSATYDVYQVVLSGVILNTVAELQLTFPSTTTGYYSSRINGSYSTGAVSTSTDNNAASMGIAVVGRTVVASGGIVTIINPFQATTTGVLVQGVDPRTTGLGGRVGSGFVDNTTSYTAFTIGGGGGTFSAGTARLYGIRNS